MAYVELEILLAYVTWHTKQYSFSEVHICPKIEVAVMVLSQARCKYHLNWFQKNLQVPSTQQSSSRKKAAWLLTWYLATQWPSLRWANSKGSFSSIEWGWVSLISRE